MRNWIILTALACAPLFAAPPFTWTHLDGDRWQLLENGKPVLVYVAGPQLKAGAPENKRRCCYVYPAFTPAGVNPLDDFPTDHLHHRGLFWAWPDVEIAGKTYDPWMKMDLHDEKGEVPQPTVNVFQAALRATNYWVLEGSKLVKEDVLITAHPARGDQRELGFEIKLEALEGPVILAGSTEKGKSYGGGLNARFAPRENTVLRSDTGDVDKDTDLVTHTWAELEGTYQGKRAVVRVINDPRNPLSPPQWCLRHYGFVGAAFPGRSGAVQSYTLEKGKPLTLRFTVQLRDVD
jgi:hypothetical protein